MNISVSQRTIIKASNDSRTYITLIETLSLQYCCLLRNDECPTVTEPGYHFPALFTTSEPGKKAEQTLLHLNSKYLIFERLRRYFLFIAWSAGNAKPNTLISSHKPPNPQAYIAHALHWNHCTDFRLYRSQLLKAYYWILHHPLALSQRDHAIFCDHTDAPSHLLALSVVCNEMDIFFNHHLLPVNNLQVRHREMPLVTLCHPC